MHLFCNLIRIKERNIQPGSQFPKVFIGEKQDYIDNTLIPSLRKNGEILDKDGAADVRNFSNLILDDTGLDFGGVEDFPQDNTMRGGGLFGGSQDNTTFTGAFFGGSTGGSTADNSSADNESWADANDQFDPQDNNVPVNEEEGE